MKHKGSFSPKAEPLNRPFLLDSFVFKVNLPTSISVDLIILHSLYKILSELNIGPTCADVVKETN